MEGYSVTEAASVLGVPTERVWELLARGVLAGAPEGETGMRVYLQPRPAPAPPEPKAPNGNGGTREPERELSPFRELLTEFRNLTERYGQALLALGESRGEVAALRSRVDMLEARIELRLPGAAAPAAAWSSSPMPFPAEQAVMPTAPQEPTATAPDHAAAAEADEEEERRARRRGPRRATESFAEALARAEDPSIPELPAPESASAPAPVRAESEADSSATEAALPRDVPAAEPVPVAEEAEAALAAPAPAQTTPAGDEAPGEIGSNAAEVASAAAIERGEPAPEPAASEPEPVVRESEGAGEAPSERPAEERADPIEAQTPVADAVEPIPAEPLEWDTERYTTDIEEPDWFAGEEFAVDQPVPDNMEDADEPAPAAEAPENQPEPVTAVDAPAEAEEPPFEPSPAADEGPGREELSQVESSLPEAETTGPDHDQAAASTGPPLAEPSDAEEIEVPGNARGRTEWPSERPASGSVGLPGSQELNDALAALNAISGPPEPGLRDAAAPDEPRTRPRDVRTELDDEIDEWPPRSAGIAESRPSPTFEPARPGTTGPASRAYRRLRRIFPG